jgi:hypothetical protein
MPGRRRLHHSQKSTTAKKSTAAKMGPPIVLDGFQEMARSLFPALSDVQFR